MKSSGSIELRAAKMKDLFSASLKESSCFLTVVVAYAIAMTQTEVNFCFVSKKENVRASYTVCI